MHLQLPSELEPVSGNGRLRLEHGSYAGRPYCLAMEICPNPCCQCYDIKFLCTPEDPPATSIGPGPLCLMMDLRQRKITVHSQKEMDAARHLGQALLQEIAPVHWQLLDERFLAVKRRLTETDDLTGFTPTFPLDAQTDGGRMVAYFEILPFAKRMQVTANEHTWLLDEQYCLHSSCSCHASAITFIRMDEAHGQRRRKPFTVTVRYNYSTGVFRRESHTSPRNPLPDLLCAALRDQYPDLNSILEKRQRKLMRLLEKVTGPRPGKIEPPPVKTMAVSAPELRPSPPASPSPGKPGRNDPCPCGSGRKYKKCCGRN